MYYTIKLSKDNLPIYVRLVLMNRDKYGMKTVVIIALYGIMLLKPKTCLRWQNDKEEVKARCSRKITVTKHLRALETNNGFKLCISKKTESHCGKKIRAEISESYEVEKSD